jgi:integrase
MPVTNLAWIQAIDNETDLGSLFIANSKFTDDVWDLRPLIPSTAIRETHKRLRFGYIDSDDMKHTIKLYAYYKLSHCKAQTVVNYVSGNLPGFVEYCNENEIYSFSGITKKHLMDLEIWLKEEKHFKWAHRRVCRLVKEIIKIGQIKGWNVPQTNILSELSKEPQSTSGGVKTKPIPPDIFDEILHHAIHDEKNIVTKAGIIVQSQTGLRISEVLTIHEGCVHTTEDGHFYMDVIISKTEKGDPAVHKVFVNELVKDAVEELEKHTEQLRIESCLKELFLIRHKGIRCMNRDNWTSKRLPWFIKRWDIRDHTGNLYHLTSHQFRATFVRELIKRKVPIAYIMKHLSHVSIEMTAHYLTLQEEEVKEIYSDLILSPDSKIAGLRAMEIKGKLNNAFSGKTEAEIEQLIADLSNSMSFNPLPTGICLYDFRRGNCSDGDGCFFYNCPNYITEVLFYPVLKAELDLMEKEMARLREIGRERDWQRQYVKWEYLKPLVESLEVQMDG